MSAAVIPIKKRSSPLAGLTQGQQEALKGLLGFIRDPAATVATLQGCAGTGKTYLLAQLLETLGDEASMVSRELYQILAEQATRSGAQVLYVGDPAQLPPVYETESVVFGLEIPSWTLTEIVRQARDNPLLGLATRLREALEGKPFPEIGSSVHGEQGIIHLPIRDSDEALNEWWRRFFEARETYSDIRHPHACTLHKSQGSTFDRVYIDLDDVGRNTKWYEIAKLLYVGLTRPRYQAVFAGSLPDRLYKSEVPHE